MNTRERILEGAQNGLLDAEIPADPSFVPALLYNDYHRGEKVFCSLEDELRHCDSFCFSTAFITLTGLEPLKPVLRELQRRRVPGKILTTNYLSFTQPEALDFLAQFETIDVRMFQCSEIEGFHTKGYLFFRNDELRLITGSSNLTASALFTSREWNTRLVAAGAGSYAREVLTQFDSLWKHMDSLPWQAVRQEYCIRYDLARKQRATALENPVFSPEQYALQPNSMQTHFIRNLKRLMEHRQQRALLVSATGTGKTLAAAFAVREFEPRTVLFLVHREQIARKALDSFRMVLGNSRTCGLLGGGLRQTGADCVFSTVQTLSRPAVLDSFSADRFDWIIVDEVHRAAAATYQRIFRHFHPRFLLGMSATPARTDGQSIFELFDYNVAADIGLRQALEEDLLCPFHYFALSGLEVSDTALEDETGFSLLTSDERVRHILEQASYYGWSGDRVMGLMFVSTKAEARRLSEKLNARGLRTLALSGEDSQEAREKAIERLTGNDGPAALDYLITVDIFNEGVDIPEVNQVLLLRPTQSAIVFTQQLGRGLRKSPGKEFVVVLDFIGLYKNNYLIPAALGECQTGNKDRLRRFVAQGTRELPGASTVYFDEVARRRIFASIDQAKMNSAKALREGFTLLMDRLGHIPALTDYDPNHAMDPLLIFSNSAYPSYPDFLWKMLDRDQRKHLPVLTETQLQFLRFVSTQWADGRRPLELLLVKALLEPDWQTAFGRLLKDFDIRLTDQEARCLMAEFTRTWLSGSGADTCPDAVFLQGDTGSPSSVSGDAMTGLLALHPSCQWETALKDPAFVTAMREVTEFGLSRWTNRFAGRRRDGWLILNEPYSYLQSFRMMDFPKAMVAQNVGGYCFDKDTRQFPVYINYEKSDDIADTIAYEDRFVNPSTLVALSKSRRTLDSQDIRRLRDYAAHPFDIPLFVRRNTQDNLKEFIYLGKMHPTGRFDQTVMKDGKTSCVQIEYELEHPVRPDLYEYFTQSEV